MLCSLAKVPLHFILSSPYPACGRQAPAGTCGGRREGVWFSKMIGDKIGHRLDPYLYTVLKKILGEHGNPNFFTLMGFFATLVASLLILNGFWFLAGLAIILSGLFDLFDGVVARKLGKVTALRGLLRFSLRSIFGSPSSSCPPYSLPKKRRSWPRHPHFFCQYGYGSHPLY